jgi:phenylacetate-CoA ligase
LRRDLEDLFSARVVDAYGMTEFGVIASESSSGEMVIDTSACSVEVIDDRGNPLPAGQVGELVISSLRNAAMPLLRYKTEDLGALDATGTRLARFVGRRIQCFKLLNGGLFSPTYFNDLFTRFTYLSEFQIIQQAIDEFQLLIDLRPGTDPAPALVEQLRAYVSRSIPGNPRVDCRIGTERGLGKFERFRTET